MTGHNNELTLVNQLINYAFEQISVNRVQTA